MDAARTELTAKQVQVAATKDVVLQRSLVLMAAAVALDNIVATMDIATHISRLSHLG